MDYIVNSFIPKKFASRYNKTISADIPATGGFTVVISSTTDLDAEGYLIIDTSTNKWEVVFYESKDDGASTITVPSWGRALRGNLTDHDSGAAIKVTPSAEVWEYFDRNLPLIKQGQIIATESLQAKILPYNGRMGNTDITYAGETVTAIDASTNYYWIDELSVLHANTTGYPLTPCVRLGRIVTAGGIVTTVYDDRKLSMASDVVSTITTGNEYSIPNVKAITDYMTAISSGIISINGVAGTIDFLEGDGIAISESGGQFTFSVDLTAGDAIDVTGDTVSVNKQDAGLIYGLQYFN